MVGEWLFTALCVHCEIDCKKGYSEYSYSMRSSPEKLSLSLK